MEEGREVIAKPYDLLHTINNNGTTLFLLMITKHTSMGVSNDYLIAVGQHLCERLGKNSLDCSDSMAVAQGPTVYDKYRCLTCGKWALAIQPENVWHRK